MRWKHPIQQGVKPFLYETVGWYIRIKVDGGVKRKGTRLLIEKE